MGPPRMAAIAHSSRHSVGKTFIVAAAILGVGALVQVGAVTWALVQRHQTALKSGSAAGPGSLKGLSTALAHSPAAASAGARASLPGGDAFDEAALPKLDQPAPGTPQPSTLPPPRPVPVPLTRPQAPPPETRFQELIQQGRLLRERGDMGNALTKLREAQTLEPRNPEAIAELARTFEKMGLADRAAEQWKRIYEMGEAAGSFFIAADARLKQSQALAMMSAQSSGAPGPADQPVSSTNPDAILGLGSITSEQIEAPEAAKRFILRVPLKTRARTRVDVRDVVIHVLFYDSVDEKTVVQTSANVTSRWASAPPDWAEGETEVLEVEYLLPKPEGAEANTDDRTYFGYIVRIYYKGQLQDTRAEPTRLAAQFPAPPVLEPDAAQ